MHWYGPEWPSLAGVLHLLLPTVPMPEGLEPILGPPADHAPTGSGQDHHPEQPGRLGGMIDSAAPAAIAVIRRLSAIGAAASSQAAVTAFADPFSDRSHGFGVG